MKIVFALSLISVGVILPTQLFASNLGNTFLNSTEEARTCFDGDCHDDIYSTKDNTSVASAYSIAKSGSVLSKIPSISARSEADELKGGNAPASFSSYAATEVSLDYHFEIVPRDNAQAAAVPVLIKATGNMSIDGDFRSTGYGYTGDAHLYIAGGTQKIFDQEILIDTGLPGPGTSKSNAFGIDEYDDLMTNTPYEVYMVVSTSAVIQEYKGAQNYADIVSSASIDPLFQLKSGFDKDYSIIYSSGIGSASLPTVPLPAAAPMFGAALLGLAGFGYATKRKKAAATA